MNWISKIVLTVLAAVVLSSVVIFCFIYWMNIVGAITFFVTDQFLSEPSGKYKGLLVLDPVQVRSGLISQLALSVICTGYEIYKATKAGKE